MSQLPEIESAQASNFEFALIELDRKKKLTDKRRKMLLHHYEAADHAISTSELAHLMGWPSDTGNLQYGTLGGLFASYFTIPDGADNLHAIGRFDHESKKWVLRDEFLQAGRSFGLFPQA